MDRPITTLFLLQSVDGKISTGASDNLDIDKDFPTIDGVKEGLHSYYEIERTTDPWSFNTGRTMAKIGANDKELPTNKIDVSFAILDNTHLNKHGLEYICALTNHLVLITSNKNHPAFTSNLDNLSIIYITNNNIEIAFKKLKQDFGCERITIQSGGTINGLLLREKLIDYVNIVIAPILIGGKDTSTLIDGESITSYSELNKLGVLKLEEVQSLPDSYIRLKYKVIS